MENTTLHLPTLERPIAFEEIFWKTIDEPVSLCEHKVYRIGLSKYQNKEPKDYVLLILPGAVNLDQRKKNNAANLFFSQCYVGQKLYQEFHSHKRKIIEPDPIKLDISEEIFRTYSQNE